MLQYTYLFIVVGSFAVTFPLCFHPKIGLLRNLKVALPAIILSSLPFLIWDEIFTQKDIWGFNTAYITGYRILSLPIEEILFFFCIPFATFFLYELFAGFRIENVPLSRLVGRIGWIGTLVLFGLGTDRTYTLVMAIIALTFTVFESKFGEKLENDKYYGLYMLTCLVGFLLMNTILTALPIVTYNSREILGFKVGTIPIEDFLYMFVMQTLYLKVYLSLKTHFVRIDVNRVQS